MNQESKIAAKNASNGAQELQNQNSLDGAAQNYAANSNNGANQNPLEPHLGQPTSVLASNKNVAQSQSPEINRTRPGDGKPSTRQEQLADHNEEAKSPALPSEAGDSADEVEDGGYGDEDEIEVVKDSAAAPNLAPISDKFFYKEMAKIKEKSKSQGSGVLPPKKSASAYIIFQKEKRPEILAKNPKAKVTEVVKEIARCWSLMSKEDRMVYKIEAKRDKERYEKELRNLEAVSSEIKKPKKCLSAYMIFVQETRPKIVDANPDLDALMVMKEVGKAWRSMTDDDRKYFKNKADNDKHRYLAESRKFYDEVARVGNQSEKSKFAQNAEEQDEEEDFEKSNPSQSSVAHAGAKRLANSASKRSNFLQGQSFGGSQSKRVAKQVMAIGLAPDNDQNIDNDEDSGQQRRRAESRFTFKPEDNSDDYENSRAGDHQNELEDEECENDSLLNDEGVPETGLQFFAKEFRSNLEAELAELKPHYLRQVIKKQWNELTLKLKSPFEQLAMLEQSRKQSASQGRTSGARRNAKAARKANVDNIVNTSNLSRTNQKLANDALEIQDALRNEIQQLLQKQTEQNSNPHDQEDKNTGSNIQPAGGVEHEHEDDVNHGNNYEFDAAANQTEVSNMYDADVFGNRTGNPASNNHGGNAANRMNQKLNLRQTGVGNGLQSLQAQNPQQLAANQAAIAFALQNQYLNSHLGANLLSNNSTLLNNSSNMLLGGNNSSILDDLSGLNMGFGAGNGIGLDPVQQTQQIQQLLQNPQSQLNQQQLLLALATQNMPQLGLGGLQGNLQHAALQQLIQQQQAAALLNPSLSLLNNKLPQFGNNQNNLQTLDILGNNQQPSMMGLRKQETPEFAGMSSQNLNLGETDLSISTLPMAATQPIQNIFYPTSSTMDDHLSLNGLLNTQNGYQGINQAHSTPINEAAVGGFQNSLFGQDFQLPASANFSSSAYPNISAEGHNQGFGNESNKGNLSQMTNRQNFMNNSPMLSPHIVPLHHNDHSHADQSQHGQPWQPNPINSAKNSIPKNGSHQNMLGIASGAANQKSSFANMSSNQGQLGVQPNPNSAKDQSLNGMNPQANMMGQTSQAHANQSFTNGSNNGTGGNDQLNSVTPFLKPNTRGPQEQLLQNQGQNQGMSSPFLAAAMHPSALGGGVNYAPMMRTRPQNPMLNHEFQSHGNNPISQSQNPQTMGPVGNSQNQTQSQCMSMMLGGNHQNTQNQHQTSMNSAAQAQFNSNTNNMGKPHANQTTSLSSSGQPVASGNDLNQNQ